MTSLLPRTSARSCEESGISEIDQKGGPIRKSWLQLDALCCSTGWDEGDLHHPQILIEDVFGESHPGSVRLDALAREPAVGGYQSGGRPDFTARTSATDGPCPMTA